MLAGSVGRFAIFAVGVGLAAGCADWQPDPDGFSEQDRALISSMELRPDALVVDGTNPVLGDPRAEALGQALFFDPTLAGALSRAQPDQLVYLGDAGATGRIACADCHAPTGFFDDTRSTPSNVSLGIEFTSRNSPSLVNVAFYRSWAWDGRSDSLWMQCSIAHESKGATGGTRLRLARRVADTHAARYQEIFDGGVDGGFAVLSSDDSAFDTTDGGNRANARYLDEIAANAYKSMAAYISTLRSGPAPFDRYAGGDPAALTLEAKRGLHLFLGRAGCIECHKGPSFTDNDFHSVGIGQRGDHVPLVDQGRFTGLVERARSAFNACGEFTGSPKSCSTQAPEDADRGLFRTKSLRNVGRTAPYMHAGQLPTLDAVVRFYNVGGEQAGFAGTKSRKMVPLGLTEEELADLVAFLHSLSGTPVDARLTCDPSPRDTDLATHRFAACPGGQ